MRAVTVSLLSLGVSLVAGCNGDLEDPPFAYEHAPDGAPLQDAGVPVIGSLELREEREIGWDSEGAPVELRRGVIEAAYFSQPPPQFLHEVARVDDCVLLRYTPALCEPACEGGAVCVDTNTCAPPADFAYAGVLTFEGLNVTPQMRGVDGYYYTSAPLPADLFDDDVVITANLSGAEIGRHWFYGHSVGTLVTSVGTLLTLTSGVATTVRWTPGPGSADSRVRLRLKADNAIHGAPLAGVIECDSPAAAGEVVIASQLIDGFPATTSARLCVGSDCPPSTIERYRRFWTPATGGGAELIVSSRYSFRVVHTPE